jgi:hypothetical protein
MLRRAAGIAGTVAMLAAAVVVVPQRGKAESSKDVIVVNGPSQPVPVSLGAGATVGVSGTVNTNVTNHPTVNLAAGTSVGINGMLGVNVLNQPAVSLAPGAVIGATDANALEPFQARIPIKIPDGADAVSALALTVPARKRFVLAELSGAAKIPTGQKVLEASAFVDDPAMTFHVGAPVTFTGTDQDGILDRFEWGRVAHAYANPGDQVRVELERNDSTAGGVVEFDIAGYLVDLP